MIETLTREQAIKRINDLSLGRCDKSHLTVRNPNKPSESHRASVNMEVGAVNELIAIFDIKDHEL